MQKNGAQKLMISYAAAISAGKLREHNEDNLYLNGFYLSGDEACAVDSGLRCFAMPGDGADSALLGVFDGMGGEDYGELASAISAGAMDRLRLELRLLPFLTEERCVTRFFARADRAVSCKARELGSKCVGSTGALAWLDRGTVITANMGDSRVYLVRSGRLRRLSHDHTATQLRIDHGELTAREAADRPRSHAICRFIGMKGAGCEVAKPYIHRQFSIKPDDVFILCSDGLTDMVGDDALLAAALDNSEPAALARRLAQQALDAGGRDNITVIAARIDSPGRHSPRTSDSGEK